MRSILHIYNSRLFGTRRLAIGLAAGLLLIMALAFWSRAGRYTVVEARIAEAGGWGPANLQATVGQPLHLRLVSGDMGHGFAVGQTEWPALAIPAGASVATSLTFEQPGKYVFYCTQWCGPGHWRMRGTIEVTGETAGPVGESTPLYVTLGLAIDAPHPATTVPSRRPSAARGAVLDFAVPQSYLAPEYYRAHSPADMWQALRAETPADVEDEAVWDLVAFVWQANTTPAALAEGEALYQANCAACHGQSGAGDGVMASLLARQETAAMTGSGHDSQLPTDFTDASQMLGAAPALLQGKILRGGMGTGMPYWGPIFTEAQTWALVDYLWTFQFDREHTP